MRSCIPVQAIWIFRNWHVQLALYFVVSVLVFVVSIITGHTLEEHLWLRKDVLHYPIEYYRFFTYSFVYPTLSSLAVECFVIILFAYLFRYMSLRTFVYLFWGSVILYGVTWILSSMIFVLPVNGFRDMRPLAGGGLL